MFERLEDGIRQVERSPAEVGCTIINLKNQIEHDETWPLVNPEEHATGKQTPTFGAWRNIQHPRDILLRLAQRRHEELVSVNGDEAIQSLLTGKKSIAGALLFLQTATALASPRGPVNSTVGVFSLMRLGDIDQRDLTALDRLNDAMHHSA